MHVLRLCSVFEPVSADAVGRARFDPIGGMQNHTASLTRALDRLGVHQTVVTSRLGAARSVESFGQFGKVIRVGLPLPALRQLWAVAGTGPAFHAGPVDVVHAHQGEDLATLPFAVAVARHHGAPLVVTVHCSVRFTVPRSGAKLSALHLAGGPLELAMLRRADGIIALTPFTAERLSEVGPPVSVIPSGAESERFEAQLPHQLLANVPRPRILYVGRLARQKDVPILVAAFGLLRSHASLVIVGDGPHQRVVDAAIAQLPPTVQGRVYRFGFRPHEEVPALLAAADLLALPSRYEEMGSVLVEALQAGLPVVASRVGGIPYVVEHGNTGLLVPPSDPAAFAAALDSLLADPQRRESMCRHSRSRAAEFRWDALAERVLGAYRTVLAARRCTSPSVAATRSTS